MDEARKKQLDNLWMKTDVGEWAIALSQGQDKKADEIINKIFKERPDPYWFLMNEEKELCRKIKTELSSKDEGKEYIQMLEKENYDLVGVMVAHDFSMLDLFYT